MKKQDKFYLLGLSLVFLLSGCVVRTYPLTRERVDQEMTGNRGYLQGQPPAGETKERTSSRTVQVVEMEFHSPLKFEKGRKTETGAKPQEQTAQGNRGFITESAAPAIAEPQANVNMQKYTVGRNDTLQKISLKFYGTTKKWNKIFQANKDKLKSPSKIYPGQVIDIPVEGMKAEGMKEPVQNLK